MKIAICDDDVLWSIKAEKIIRSFDQKAELELDIITFNDAKDLLSYAGSLCDGGWEKNYNQRRLCKTDQDGFHEVGKFSDVMTLRGTGKSKC